MDTYKVKPLEEPMEVCVQVPGSKSMTNRALLLAAMGEGMTLLHGVQFSEDSLHFLTALQDLGFDVHADQEACTVRIRGFGGQIPKEQATIYVGSAGTAARFLTAFVAMSAGRYRLNASDQMNKRPMRELLRALEELGARFTWLGEPYRFPMEVYGMGQRYGEYRVQLNIDRSSQFLSALLMTAPTAIDMLTIELTGKRSARSYVEMTEHMMCQFGHSGVLKHEADCYQVRRGDYEARVRCGAGCICSLLFLCGGSSDRRKHRGTFYEKGFAARRYALFGRIGTDGLYQAVGTHGRNRRAGT